MILTNICGRKIKIFSNNMLFLTDVDPYINYSTFRGEVSFLIFSRLASFRSITIPRALPRFLLLEGRGMGTKMLFRGKEGPNGNGVHVGPLVDPVSHFVKWRQLMLLFSTFEQY